MRRLCRELLARQPTEAGHTPLEVLASCQGIRHIHHSPLDAEMECSGLLVPKDGGYEVTLRSDETEERRRFSLGHEICHTFINDYCPGAAHSDEIEKLCNIGASELTMPAERFVPFLAERTLSLAAFDDCAEEFGVSFPAARRRAMDLTDQVACVFVACVTRTKKQKQFGIGQPVLRIVEWSRSRVVAGHRDLSACSGD